VCSIHKLTPRYETPFRLKFFAITVNSDVRIPIKQWDFGPIATSLQFDRAAIPPCLFVKRMAVRTGLMKMASLNGSRGLRRALRTTSIGRGSVR
jgi:hypothetical protein